MDAGPSVNVVTEMSQSETLTKGLLKMNFDDLEKSWQRFAFDPRVKDVLSVPAPYEDASSTKESNALDEYVSQIDENLMLFETQSVEDYVKSCKELLLLHQNIQKCDSILLGMEDRISTFQNTLADISSKIKRLQSESLDMNMKVSNRKLAYELFSTFTQQILVTPALISAINESPLDENYSTHLEVLTKKLEHATQPGVQEVPTTKESLPELEKLKNKAVGRVRDFLADKILSLKRPKTNIQIIQRNVLVKLKKYYQFLMDNHPQAAWDIRQVYVTTLSRIYSNQFRFYYQSLSRLPLEAVATQMDCVGSRDSGKSSLNMKGVVGTVFGLSNNTANVTAKGNIFSLLDRDKVLQELDAALIVPHAVSAEQDAKFYYERIFWSHQKLLIDTVTSEYLFLIDFFLSVGVDMHQSLFTDVFGKTILFFLDSVESYLSTCYDCIGLYLMAKINDNNRVTMERRRIPCLESYLDRVQCLIWPRLKFALDANIQSLKNVNTKAYMDMPSSQRTHPHYVTKRYADLSSSLAALNGLVQLPDFPLQTSLAGMEAAFHDFIKALAREFGALDYLVFLINNYDTVLSAFVEKKLSSELCAGFTKRLQDTISMYVEQQLNAVFSWLISFVRSGEELIERQKNRLLPEQLAAELDVSKMEKLVTRFQSDWQKGLDTLQSKVMAHFTSFTNGMEILKQVLTQVLLYYNRFQQIIAKCFPRQPQPLWTKNIVPTNTILTAIAQYSKSL